MGAVFTVSCTVNEKWGKFALVDDPQQLAEQLPLFLRCQSQVDTMFDNVFINR